MYQRSSVNFGLQRVEYIYKWGGEINGTIRSINLAETVDSSIESGSVIETASPFLLLVSSTPDGARVEW